VPLTETSPGAQRARTLVVSAARRLGPWVLYFIALYVVLRPVLLTTVAADDLINPFSQLYHGGSSLPDILRNNWKVVTATGHFNYIGQSIGSAVVYLWLFFVADLEIHYTTVYAVSKYVVFAISFLVLAELIRATLRYGGFATHRWRIRAGVLVTAGLLIQIHIPWSNDPVASYPLAGYLTAAVGFAFILLFLWTTASWTWTRVGITGAFGVLAVLYYEFNSFALAAVGPVLAYEILRQRRDPQLLRQRVTQAFACVGPAALTVVYFYSRNKAQSANYEGTAISLGDRFPTVFRNGMLSSLPGTSWSRAEDWMPYPSPWTQRIILYFAIALGLIGSILWLTRKVASETASSSRSITRLLIASSALFIYWAGATLTQTATVKIQKEASGIGQVYNYYAIGASAFGALFVVAAFAVDRRKIPLAVRGLVLGAVILVCANQYRTNTNVTIQFNGVVVPTGNLLNVYSEGRDMTQRCQALDWWKTMGWPEYYWLDMEIGMNLSYELYRGEPFCRR
jgi:hypothetical protein